MVERLRSRGLVAMHRLAMDRRRQVWRTTPAGQTLLSQAAKHLNELAASVGDGLDDRRAASRPIALRAACAQAVTQKADRRGGTADALCCIRHGLLARRSIAARPISTPTRWSAKRRRIRTGGCRTTRSRSIRGRACTIRTRSTARRCRPTIRRRTSSCTASITSAAGPSGTTTATGRSSRIRPGRSTSRSTSAACCRLNRDDAVRLALLHSRDYQQQLETLYLSALDVSFERFRVRCAVLRRLSDLRHVDRARRHGQFEQHRAGGGTFTAALGGTRAAPNAASAPAAAGPQLAMNKAVHDRRHRSLVDFANSLVWQFSGQRQLHSNDAHRTFRLRAAAVARRRPRPRAWSG